MLCINFEHQINLYFLEKIQNQTLSPTWNETLIANDVRFMAISGKPVETPPLIMLVINDDEKV